METYSVTTDFGGDVPNVGQLHNEIVNSSITKTLHGVTTFDDIVNIEFDLTLSGAEKTTLDGLVASHVPVYIPETPNSLNIIPRSNNITTSTYKRLVSDFFPGTAYATAKCISYMNSNSTSYSILIFDKNNPVSYTHLTLPTTPYV